MGTGRGDSYRVLRDPSGRLAESPLWVSDTLTGTMSLSLPSPELVEGSKGEENQLII